MSIKRSILSKLIILNMVLIGLMNCEISYWSRRGYHISGSPATIRSMVIEGGSIVIIT